MYRSVSVLGKLMSLNEVIWFQLKSLQKDKQRQTRRAT